MASSATSSTSSIHLAIIPDGNRRWAKKRSLHPWKGHEIAIENFRTITDWARADERIDVLTVWCFSTENWKRDAKEVKKLMKMLKDYLDRERDTFTKNRTRFVHSGRKDRIPPSLAKLIEDIEEKTNDYDAFTLHLAIDYGGKDELLRAMRKMSDEAKELTEDDFRSRLDHPELSDIDLVVRTSGEHRTSNFFLWQSTYAEWIFSDKLFPDFSVDDLEQALEEWKRRTRRLGA